jgi:hypothetical protein
MLAQPDIVWRIAERHMPVAEQVDDELAHEYVVYFW